jgi:hypothetical protein
VPLHPRVPTDIVLAPVAAEVDLNLQPLREMKPKELDTELQLQLGGPPAEDTRDARAAHIVRAALRDVERHGWDGSITEDSWRLRLAGGSVTLELGLSAGITRYIEMGPDS